MKTRVVLCVDNEPPALAVRSLILRGAGYDVLSAADGTAALELFKCLQVDLVITDHRLPGITGTQLAAEIKRINPAIPVILCSGLGEAPLESEHANLVLDLQ